MSNVVDQSAAWFLNAPEVAQVAVLAALIAFLSMLVALTGAVLARRQAVTSRQALFASLLEKRINWLDSFRAAVMARNEEISRIPAIDNPFGDQSHKEPVALFAVSDAARMAQWLFDGSVAGHVNKIVELLNQKTRLVIVARGETARERSEAAKQVGNVAWEIEQTLDALVKAIKPFMYVGDVKNPSREAKAPPKLKNSVRSSMRAP